MIVGLLEWIKGFWSAPKPKRRRRRKMPKEVTKSLDRWSKQKWRTPSGKPSGKTGEVYAPSATIKKLKSTAAGRRKLAAANRKKEATRKGKQHARHGLHKTRKDDT